MARVYDALKRVEEERTLLERSSRQATRTNGTQPSGWSTWFRRSRQPLHRALPAADRQLLNRLDKLAGEVESVRLARKTTATDVEARVEMLKAQIGRLEIQMKELDHRLSLAVGTTADGVRSRLSEVSNRLLLVGAVSVLALCVALLRP